MSEKVIYSYYTSEQASQNAFYRVPRALYEKEYFRVLSNDAKTLYALMLDRMSLSLANEWLDEEGRVYINYSIESIMEILNCGKTKAIALLKELDSESGIGLIEKKNMGIAKASVFYVKNFILEDKEQKEDQDVKNEPKSVQKMNSKKHDEFNKRTCTSSENELDCVQNLNTNKNKINKTELNQTHQILSIKDTDEIDEMDSYSSFIKDNIEYDCLLQRHPYDQKLIQGIFELILETVLIKNKKIVIAGNSYPTNLVKNKFLKIDFLQVEYVINCLEKNTTKIHNIKSYLLASLFNAGSTISGYYKAQVNQNMPQYAR